QVFKIPPVYERPTASNISFEKGGVFNVSKPCNRQPRLSSASRGVRLWPLEEESSKMDTVPLLSPTMESELLKGPWVFPQPKTNITKEEEKATSSTWEENFQDLSGWCMDTFQGQCDFHAGESPTFKLSGTKYEGNSVLSSEERVLKDLMSVADEEKWNVKMNTAETNEPLSNNCQSLQLTSDVTSKYEKEDSTAVSNTPNLWLKLSKGSAATINRSSWSKQNNTDVSTPSQSRYPIEDIDLNNAGPTSFDSIENQRETWDVLKTVETTGSDTFDLLSYLCDDEMRSPEGSVSTDSSVASKPWSTTSSSVTTPQTSIKVKTEKNETVPPSTESRAASTITSSSSMETSSTVTSRRTERVTRSTVTNKVEKTYSRARREKASRKRYVETSDTDDQTFVSHYRESREKNNEASRKSRMNKKAKEIEMSNKATELERVNRMLKMKVEELEKLVTTMRSALLRSALKKEM
ncbi:hypothetical protein WH47_10728, partial [Habropoda laboriosa]